jgi:hypothetical protein
VKLARGQNGAWMAAAQGRGGCKRRRCSGEDGCGRRRTVAVRRGARISNTVLSRASCRARTLEKAHNYSPRCFGFIDSSQPTSAAIHLSSPMRFVLRGDETGASRVAGLAQTRPAVVVLATGIAGSGQGRGRQEDKATPRRPVPRQNDEHERRAYTDRDPQPSPTKLTGFSGG